ncbi:MAG: hypothetical protein LLF96_06945, partial [Eubacteriales bacterium]|nr:hypothetical protein [Eubacteriales bacterium]
GKQVHGKTLAWCGGFVVALFREGFVVAFCWQNMIVLVIRYAAASHTPSPHGKYKRSLRKYYTVFTCETPLTVCYAEGK